MSTVEIAELTGKQHRYVLRDARKMLADLDDGPKLGSPPFEGTYLNAQNKERETMILITGYSVTMRRR